MPLIVEMARNPARVTEALYPYEPSGTGKDAAGTAAREETVARIVVGEAMSTAVTVAKHGGARDGGAGKGR